MLQFNNMNRHIHEQIQRKLKIKYRKVNCESEYAFFTPQNSHLVTNM